LTDIPNEATPGAVTKEIRFAVVMYGGVSLAIYMNGIAQELLHLVRSTAREAWNGSGEGTFLFNSNQCDGTEKVYRKVAQFLSGASEDGNHLRFIVDIVSGTSAGGINGIFLSKALANNETMDDLKEMWITEGDISKLLNDQESHLPGLDNDSPPRSLLNSDRMYIKLFEAFRAMERTRIKSAPDDRAKQVSLVKELDLFVTTTDINGQIVPLSLFDRLVYERRYKYAFRFRHDTERQDFTEANDAFLAFAARCTSSFPFAFQPMQLFTLRDLLQSCDDSNYHAGGKYSYDSRLPIWTRDFLPRLTFTEYETGAEYRSFGDGGYLNNKPFSYAIELLSKRSAEIPGERKLLYIEPSPEDPERGLMSASPKQRMAATVAPNALQNSTAALLSIPRYETIQEDLQRVIDRNRLIRKVNELVSLVSYQLEQTAEAQGQPGPEMSLQKLRDDEKCCAYVGYHLIRVYALTDELAQTIAHLSDVDEQSSHYFALRCLVRQWRMQTYVLDGRLMPEQGESPASDMADATYSKFLLEFDISYCLRQTMFVRTQINTFYDLDWKELDGETVERLKRLKLAEIIQDETRRREFSEGLLILKAEFDAIFRNLRDVVRGIQDSGRQSETEMSPPNALRNSVHNLRIGHKELDEILGVSKGNHSGVSAVGSKTEDRWRRVFAPQELDSVDGNLLLARAGQILERPEVRSGLDALQGALKERLSEAMKSSQDRAKGVLEESDKIMKTEGSREALRLVRFYYSHFYCFDSVLFPILYETETGEPEHVDIVRISPEDATAIVDENSPDGHPKLMGTTFGHFGAFLEKTWRQNDILWGRLDGAERLIRVLLPPGHPRSSEVPALIREAQKIIIGEELRPEDKGEICEMLVDALFKFDKTNRTTAENVEVLMESLSDEIGATDINPKLKAILQDALTLPGLLSALSKYQMEREPNREQSLKNMARATQVVGKMLDGIAAASNNMSNGILRRSSSFLVRVGRLLWGLVEIAVPQSAMDIMFRYWFRLLLLVEVILIVAGIVFATSPVQAIGFKLLYLTLFVRAIIELMRSFISGRKWWWKLPLWAIASVSVILLVLGAFEVPHIYDLVAKCLGHIRVCVHDTL
jgi:patatin-related protein